MSHSRPRYTPRRKILQEGGSEAAACRTSVVASQEVAADLWTGPRSSLQSSLRRYSEPGGESSVTVKPQGHLRSPPGANRRTTQRALRTFVDEEAGVDEQPVTIFLRRLQRQRGGQLVLQEGQRHPLLQVVGGGGEAGRQATSTAAGGGDTQMFV